MTQQMEAMIAAIPNHEVAPRSTQSSLTLSDRQVNDSAQNKILNSVTNSSDVHISNTSNNIYNAPVVINNIYQQSDDIDESPKKEATTAPQNSFSKISCSIFRAKVQQLFSEKCYITILVLLLLVFALIIGLMIWLLHSKNSQAVHSDSPSNATSGQMDFRIVYRTEWKAELPKDKADSLSKLPPPLVIIHHTVTALCYFLEQCINAVKIIQNNHMNHRGWKDIGYNFLVGGDGLVYEGRGWKVAASHTVGYNYWSIGIGLIGTFSKEEPTKVQLRATLQLIEYGVKNGYISVDYKLLGHRQCRSSDNPGDALYSIIMTWDHWSSKCQLT